MIQLTDVYCVLFKFYNWTSDYNSDYINRDPIKRRAQYNEYYKVFVVVCRNYNLKYSVELLPGSSPGRNLRRRPQSENMVRKPSRSNRFIKNL